MSPEYVGKVPLVLSSMCIAIGMAVAGFFISETVYKSKVALNLADVKGLAERRVKADKAHWTIGYTVTGKDKSEIPKLYADSERDQKMILAILKESGFRDEELTPGVISYNHKEYRDKSQVLVEEEHRLVGEITVETDQVDLVAGARANLNKLIAQGLDISNNAPSYVFTRLNDIVIPPF